ncbi:MAG: hypothetical protein AMXMBFR84_46400 [Candidatus Hydrogenedentota bacterium]
MKKSTQGPEIIGDIGRSLNFKDIASTLRNLLLIVVVVSIGLWFFLGGPVYTVGPDEEGLVLRFGRYIKSAQPGFYFKMPWPINSVEKVNVRAVRRLEFGYTSYSDNGQTNYQDFRDSPALLDEARMLTGDENVVDCSMAVQYQVTNATAYAFNFDSAEDVEKALRDIGESALRKAVGDRPIDHVLTTRKEEIQVEIKENMQMLATKYGAGVTISEVQLQDVKPPDTVEASFQEVASSREMREKLINEALAYQSEKLPQAEGEAERIKQEALGYKEALIAEVKGDVSRFQALAAEYTASPEITRTRLYLEAMSELVPKVRLTVIDESAGIVNLKQLQGGTLNLPEGYEYRNSDGTPVSQEGQSQ